MSPSSSGLSRAGSPAAEAGAGRYLAVAHAMWLEQEPQRRWRELDATLLFADVSGFTALGERLARGGRVGTEELTDVVKAVFARMLEPVRALGGDLVKFGGDAALVLFEGEEHERRAAAAALAMQDAIRSLQGTRTSAGAVSLRLSAGVASGPLHLFLTGSAFKDLVVAGPLVSEVCRLEGGARPGEVLAGARTAGALGLRRRTADGRPGVAVRSVPPVLTAAVAEMRCSRPWAGLPAHLHDHTPGEGEHRLVTAAFVQFRGVDALLARSGPEALADALDELSGGAQEVCATYGITLVATDVDRDAGKFYLVTGAPTTGTDDEGRMLHAVKALVRRSWPLPVRAGVNRGRAFVVDVGLPDRLCWSVLGDTVNLAARLMGNAPPGGVLATSAVLDCAREAFGRTPVEPFMAKGKRLPVRAELVGEPQGARRAVAPVGAFVGRERELGVLRVALTSARAGGRPAVQLAGEPGIGKTRLLDAALAESDGFRLVTVHGGPYSASSPYAAVQAPLRELIGCTRRDPEAAVTEALAAAVRRVDFGLAPWLPLIGIPFGLALEPTAQTRLLGPEFARARLHAALMALLEGLLRGAPLLLVVEDAHWLDEASSDLLSHLIRRLDVTHRATIVTRRRGPAGGLDLAGGEDVTAVEVEPLPDSAAERLLRTDGPALTPRARAELLERAAGNPLLLGELAAAARAAGGDLTGLPDTVEALIMARIDTLSAEDRALLRQAAVLGVRFDVDVLSALVGFDADEAAAAVDRLEDFIVCVAQGAMRFRHALARDAAYESLPFRVRRRLHARAAELIEARAATPEDHVELLSLHFHAAHRWRDSWRWSRLAGEQATRQGAPVEAVGFLSAALEAGRRVGDVPPADLGAVAEALGDAANVAARFDVAAGAYREARRSFAGDPLRLAELYRKEGRLRERSQGYGQAKRWYTRAMRLLQGDERREAVGQRARIACFRGAAELRQGRLRACLPYLLEAVDGAEAAGDRATLAHAYYLLDWAYTDAGSPEARRYRDLALPIYEELGDELGVAGVYNNLGIDAYYEGRWEDAVALYERSRVGFERGGDVVMLASALNNIGEIRSDQGRLDEAEALLQDALDIWQAASFPAGEGIAMSNLGRVAGRAGDLATARERLTQARSALTAIGAQALALEADAREAERRLLDGDPQGALAVLAAVRAAQDRIGATHAVSAMVRRIAACAHLQAGAVDDGRAQLVEALAYARSIHSPYEEALALEALALAGGPEATTHRRGAEVIFDRLGVVRRPELPLRRAAPDVVHESPA